MLKCCRCENTKEEQYFHKRKCKRGYSYLCKECDKERMIKHREANGFFVLMFRNAKMHARVRTENGRLNAGAFELTLGDLENKWIKQKGKCFYSNIEMCKKSYSDWTCSLERLDNNLGYTKDNSVLICLEFNTACTQWSLEKIKAIPELLKKEIQLLDENLNLSKRLIITKNKDNMEINSIMHGFCRYCKLYIPLNELHENFTHRGCINCIREYTKNVKSTLFGYLSTLITYSRQNKSHMEYNIDLNFLKQLYKNQKGRCAYSNIPLQLLNDKNEWIMSIERVDSKIGYIKSNVCLICREFNSMDRSAVSERNSGSCGWNLDKFNIFLKSAYSL